MISQQETARSVQMQAEQKNNSNSIASMLRQKLSRNQKIDINQIKQYYDINSHNVSYQYAPSNPIGPKQLNNQAQKPDYNESNSFSSPVKTELSETPQIMRKSKRVVFNESQISQIIPIDQQQINYLKRNFISENNNKQEEDDDSENNQNIKMINQEYEKTQRQFDEDPIQIEAISQSVTPVKINRNNSKKDEQFSQRKSGNVTRFSTNQSLCDEQILEEIRNWEKMFDVDKTVLGQVETTFKNMEDRISDLEAQFEICYHLTGKMEQKYQDLHKLLKGTPIFKVSRANKKKANLRIFFYSPSLEAFCWKSPKDNFPEKKQLVYIKNIKEVHTRLDAARKLPQPFTEQQYLRIVMIDKKEQDLELICEDIQLRTILLKVISSLIEDIRKSQHIKQNNQNQSRNQNTPSLITPGANCEFLITKYSKDIQNIKDQMTSTKSFFGDSTQLLRNAFFQATQSLVQKERKKRKQFVQQQKQELIQKNKEAEEEKQKVSTIIQIEKEDYDNLAYQNLELKQEIQDLEYEKQSLAERLNSSEQYIQQLINTMSESINKLCQAPPVQDLQQYFYQIEYTQPQQQQQDSFYNNLQQNENGEQLQNYSETVYNQENKNIQQQYFYQIEQIKNILSQCVDKIIQEYFGLVESQSNYQRNTTATNSDKFNSPSQNDYMSIRRNIVDKEEEIKKVKNYNSEINDKYQILLAEYNKLVNEKKINLDKQEEVQRINKYLEIENVEIKQDNTELKEQIDNLLNEIASKEDNFTCIVEGLQLMRDEILDQADLLQEELKSQQLQFEQLQKQSQPSTLKLTYLENKLKEKDQQIKQLVEQHDKQLLAESRNKTNESIHSNENSAHSLKVNNQLLVQENSSLKCQLLSISNKNQYLEKLVIQLQQQPSYNQNNQQINKENVHPNVLSSELSFKVRHERTPSQNSLQFQSKQFNLLNQRNTELQSQLEASSALVKELEQKIVHRDTYRSSKKPSDEFQQSIQSHHSQTSSSSNIHHNKNNYDSSHQKFFLHQKNQSLKQFPQNEIISYALSPNNTNNRINNKF